MTKWLFNIFTDHFFMINILILAVFFSCRLKKRSWYGARIVLGVVVCIFAESMITYKNGTFDALFSFAVSFLLAVIVVFFVYAISVVEAFYATACAYAVQHVAYGIYCIIFRPSEEVPIYSWRYLFVFVSVAVLYYFVIGRNLPENGRFQIDLRFSLESLGIILFLVLGLSLIAGNMFNNSHNELYYVCMGYDVICCIFVLWEQMDYQKKIKMQREQAIEEQLRLKQKELYRLRKDDIERINLLCHDMKKHLESLKLFANEQERKDYYDKVSETIASYDAQFETGSKVLDILLAQKNLLCVKNEIELTCVADGKKLNFLSAVDLYTILGNVIDNAIEGTLLVSDPEKKMISVSIWAKGKLLLIQIENYYENPELKFENGYPLTSKKSDKGHGYGLKSVRKTVEKYGGSMDISAENHLFQITIVIPIPE